jgi:hypothetical protein
VSDWTPSDRALRDRFRVGAATVDAAFAALSEDDLDRRDSPAEWSARMIAHHLADAEVHLYTRLRQLLADEPPVHIEYWDEALWATTASLGYESRPLARSLAVFHAARNSSAALLAHLDAADLDRAGVHSTEGPYTLRTWLAMAASHVEDHASQIVAVSGRGRS